MDLGKNQNKKKSPERKHGFGLNRDYGEGKKTMDCEGRAKQKN